MAVSSSGTYCADSAATSVVWAPVIADRLSGLRFDWQAVANTSDRATVQRVVAMCLLNNCMAEAGQFESQDRSVFAKDLDRTGGCVLLASTGSLFFAHRQPVAYRQTPEKCSAS